MALFLKSSASASASAWAFLFFSCSNYCYCSWNPIFLAFLAIIELSVFSSLICYSIFWLAAISFMFQNALFFTMVLNMMITSNKLRGTLWARCSSQWVRMNEFKYFSRYCSPYDPFSKGPQFLLGSEYQVAWVSFWARNSANSPIQTRIDADTKIMITIPIFYSKMS